MKKVWDRRKKGIFFYLMRIPIFLLIIVVNIILLSWLGYVLYSLFTDSQIEVSLWEWGRHLYILVRRFVQPLFDLL